MPEQNTSPPVSAEAAVGAYADRLTAATDRLRRAEGLELRLNEPMGPHTSLGVGGPADLYAIVLGLPGVSAALGAAGACGLPLLVTGRGTNLLVRDGGFRGLVLHFGEAFAALSREGNRISAESGATLSEVCECAATAGLSGLEFAAGIPGSVGGAAAMNAGTGGGQIADVIEAVEAVCESGALVRCEREELRFDYRRSCLRDERCVAVRVTFRLRPADPQGIRRVMLEAIQKRCGRQPLSLGSAGSVFKRPPGDYAGRLLEAAGVKGMRMGGARFSPKHANFIVNEGHASAEDVLRLIEAAKQRVHEFAQVRLEEEICIVGEPPPTGR